MNKINKVVGMTLLSLTLSTQASVSGVVAGVNLVLGAGASTVSDDSFIGCKVSAIPSAILGTIAIAHGVPVGTIAVGVATETAIGCIGGFLGDKLIGDLDIGREELKQEIEDDLDGGFLSKMEVNI